MVYSSENYNKYMLCNRICTGAVLAELRRIRPNILYSILIGTAISRVTPGDKIMVRR